MKDQQIFDRVEKKYLIDEQQKRHLLKTIQKQMRPDDYYQSEIFNIYFDTDQFDLIIQSIEQPMFKAKLRARSYGGYDKVFFEIKTKLCGGENNVGYKRRMKITKKEYAKLVKKGGKIVDLVKNSAGTDVGAGESMSVSANAGVSTRKKSKKNAPPAKTAPVSQNDLRIAEEIDYLIAHFDLKPQILVFYERESYQGEEGLRLTFDENLKYRTRNLNFTKRKDDKNFFTDEKNIIMEIKAHEVMPLWLVKALSAEKVYPQQFSKISKIYQQIRKEEQHV